MARGKPAKQEMLFLYSYLSIVGTVGDMQREKLKIWKKILLEKYSSVHIRRAHHLNKNEWTNISPILAYFLERQSKYHSTIDEHVAWRLWCV